MATSPPIQPQIDTILVPQGIEFRKVSRGLWATGQTQCRVVSIPLGSQGLTRFLDQWLGAQEQKNYPQNVVLMGLCGSLSPEIQGGNVVIYQGCTGRIGHRSDFVQRCNPELTDCIEQKLHAVAVVKTIQRVQGFTSDRVISSAQEKQQIHQIYQADVVDMEGFIVLEHLNSQGISGAILRVVSDGCHQDLPDLNSAIDDDGNLQILPLLTVFLQQPAAAAQLIQGSIKALRVLQEITTGLGTQT